MNQAKILSLVTKLKCKVHLKAGKLKNYNGQEGRVLKLQKSLTSLLKYEMLELNFHRAIEVRGYAELVSV